MIVIATTPMRSGLIDGAVPPFWGRLPRCAGSGVTRVRRRPTRHRHHQPGSDRDACNRDQGRDAQRPSVPGGELDGAEAGAAQPGRGEQDHDGQQTGQLAGRVVQPGSGTLVGLIERTVVTATRGAENAAIPTAITRMPARTSGTTGQRGPMRSATQPASGEPAIITT